MVDDENRVEQLPSEEDVAQEEPIQDDDVPADPNFFLEMKTQGNASYAAGNVVEALGLYRRGIAAAPQKPVLAPSATQEEEKKEEKQVEEVVEGSEGEGTTDICSEATPDGTSGTDYTQTAQLYANAGLCAMKLGQWEDAISYLSQALHHDERYQKALLRRAECYYHTEKFSSAFADYEAFEKLGGTLIPQDQQRKAHAKEKQDEEMKKMLGDLKNLANQCLGWVGLSTDNFKFDKDPSTGSYSMRFEQNHNQ